MQAIVIRQMILFFAVFLVGFFCARRKVIQKEGLPHLARLMAKVLLPVLMFSVTYCGITWSMIRESAVVLLLAAAFYLIVTLVLLGTARGFRLAGDRGRVFRFAFTFGNTGFVGAPLLTAMDPVTGGLYLALFSVVDQILFWTYGVRLATASDRRAQISLRSVLNPNLVAIMIALLLVLAGVRLPVLAEDVLNTLRNAVPAVSMLYLGALFAFSDWRPAFRSRELYGGIAVKMILLPFLLGRLLGMTGLDGSIVRSMSVLMALPTMTVVPMIAEMYGHEGPYAAGLSVATLAAGIVTIPLVAALAF